MASATKTASYYNTRNLGLHKQIPGNTPDERTAVEKALVRCVDEAARPEILTMLFGDMRG